MGQTNRQTIEDDASSSYTTINQRESLEYEDDIPLRQLEHDEGVHWASVAEKKRLWWRNAVISGLFIAAWFLFSTLLSVYNKWMFAPEHFGFPAPLFVSSMHMTVQFSLAALMRHLWPKQFKPPHNPSREDYAKKAFPTAATTALDIGLSNLSLKVVTLSFYTMVKSSSLIFVLFFAFLFRLETFSWRLVAVIMLIFAGVVMMVASGAQFLLNGMLLVLGASAFGGLRWSMTQVLLKSKNIGFDNPAATIFWLAPAMGVCLGIFSMAMEGWGTLFRSVFFSSGWKITQTVFLLTAPGAIAFCMVLSEFYVIQRAGVVPMSIAGIGKEVSTILISTWFFGDRLTLVNGIGVGITMCGIGLFTHHKYRKTVESTVPLDAHGNPVGEEPECAPLAGRPSTGSEEEVGK